jgi:Ca2+-binding EF-hand superfamily protein
MSAGIVETAGNIFDSYDEDNSGSLSTQEFKKVLKEVLHEISKTVSVDEKKMNQLFTIYDKNNDSKISRKEFTQVIRDFIEPIYANKNL